MIKIRGTVNGRDTVILGLSHANLDRLRKEGLSGFIMVKAEDLEIPYSTSSSPRPRPSR